MTPALLLLLLLAQFKGPNAIPAAPAPASSVSGRVVVQLRDRNVEVALKGLVVGLGQPGARYLGAAEVRWRFLAGRLYALSSGGTLLYPEVDGTLRPRAFASLGLGVDDAR